MILSLAEAGFYRPRWSSETLTETEAAIAAIRTKQGDSVPAATALKQREAIVRAFPEAVVEGHNLITESLLLPDPKDRHVLAAAIHSRSAVIVTENISDFPAEYIAQFEIQVSTTDEFLADIIDLDTSGAVAAIRTMRQRFHRPELDPEALLTKIEGVGLTLTADLLIGEIDSL